MQATANSIDDVNRRGFRRSDVVRRYGSAHHYIDAGERLALTALEEERPHMLLDIGSAAGAPFRC